MSKSQSNPTIAAPLAAFGGWSDAEWFSSSVVLDTEIVGFTLPALPGSRKQNFRVIDRASASHSRAARKGQAVRAQPKRTAGKLAVILDSYAALRIVACCRSKLLFESGAVIFFAELPLARLKPRSASKLRRELINIGLRACIVQLEAASATVMVWPSAEQEITAFVEAAQPEQQLHIDFDKAPAAPGNAGSLKPTGVSGKPSHHDAARESKLLKEVVLLRKQVETLKRTQTSIGAMQQLGIDDARLKAMLKLLHPDKHGSSEAANDAATWLNNLRDLLKDKNPV